MINMKIWVEDTLTKSYLSTYSYHLEIEEAKNEVSKIFENYYENLDKYEFAYIYMSTKCIKKLLTKAYKLMVVKKNRYILQLTSEVIMRKRNVTINYEGILNEPLNSYSDNEFKNWLKKFIKEDLIV